MVNGFDHLERGIPMGTRFLADSMLGRLAKWLRIMGYDTHYQAFYSEDVLGKLVHEGRKLLSRHRTTTAQYPSAMLIHSDDVGDQLRELRDGGNLTLDRSKWFTRCLSCNVSLEKADPQHAQEDVPEYIFYQTPSGIRFCPSCGRYFWPGSHRDRMILRLREWGF
jgi:uncharacterized protein with PIN domain